MPGWHAAAKKWVDQGKLQIVGVIQEQHPERCRLFAQWHEIDWPIVHDPINLLGNSAVPIAVALDEHGIIRSTRPNPRTFERDFLNVKFEAPQGKPVQLGVTTDWKSASKTADADPSAPKHKLAGDSLVLWGGADQTTKAVRHFEKAIQLAPKDPTLIFRLGVAYQMRNESKHRQSDDFAQAVSKWQKALAANPNQYIWRRRIQQYGPRLDKPYPFYDWVADARKEIKARGEVPVSLPVEPVGAELASRSRDVSGVANEKNPDPKAQITRDTFSQIEISSVVVPNTSKPKTSSMVHVLFSPNKNVTWSNEAGPLEVWIEGAGIKQSQKLFRKINKAKDESSERRKVEVEILRNGDSRSLKGYALYYVCENEGQCRFLRQDFEIVLD